CRRDLGEQSLAQLAPRGVQARLALVEGLHLQRHIRLEFRTVGDVQIGTHERVPAADESEERAHLGRVRLRVVAIQVEILRSRAPAGFLRTVLVRPVPAAEAFVPVDVEGWHEEYRDTVQGAGSSTVLEQLAQRDEARILPVAL